VSLHEALPASGLCAALTRAKARALGKGVDKKSAQGTPMPKLSERAKRLQRWHENPGSHRHKTDGAEPVEIEVPVEAEEVDLFQGISSPDLGELLLPPAGRIEQTKDMLQKEDELLEDQKSSEEEVSPQVILDPHMSLKEIAKQLELVLDDNHLQATHTFAKLEYLTKGTWEDLQKKDPVLKRVREILNQKVTDTKNEVKEVLA
jgi:hypothetical protein